MRRWLINLAAAVSLVLCLATVVAWARSYFVADLLQYYRESHSTPLLDLEDAYDFSSGNGGFSLVQGHVGFAYHDAAEASRIRGQSGYVYDGRFRLNWMSTPRWYGGTLYDNSYTTRFAGFGFRSWTSPPPWKDEGWGLTLPWAVPGAIFGLLPGLVLWRMMRGRGNRRMKKGLCSNCGYDLRATPERCPECGTVVHH